MRAAETAGPSRAALSSSGPAGHSQSVAAADARNLGESLAAVLRLSPGPAYMSSPLTLTLGAAVGVCLHHPAEFTAA